MGETLTGHIKSEENPADLLTKIVNGNKCRHLVSLVPYDIYDGLAKSFQKMDMLLRGLERIGRYNIV